MRIQCIKLLAFITLHFNAVSFFTSSSIKILYARYTRFNDVSFFSLLTISSVWRASTHISCRCKSSGDISRNGKILDKFFSSSTLTFNCLKSEMIITKQKITTHIYTSCMLKIFMMRWWKIKSSFIRYRLHILSTWKF